MATNPMQRKARNSFLLGMVITLLFSAIIIFLLWRQTQTLNEKINSDTLQKSKVHVLKRDVTSGEVLTLDMFETRDVTKNAVPSDATSIATVEGTPIAKVDLKANTVLTSSMIEAQEEKTTDDMREQTYNMITLPIDLVTGDYVDIRLMLPNGQDYIVISKTKATIPDINGVPVADTIKLNITEGDLLTLSSAIVEAYTIEGSKLYAIKYTEAGNQKESSITYVPKAEVYNQIKNNPNIVEDIMAKYTDRAKMDRNDYINKAYQNGNADGAKTGIQESAEATKEAREEYLSSLYGGLVE